MRYLCQNKENIYMKCPHCKQVQIFPREGFGKLASDQKKCPGCGKPFSIVWGWYPAIFGILRKVIPILVMTGLVTVFLLVILFPWFQRSYIFNRYIMTPKPLISSFGIPVLCSAISILPSIIPFMKKPHGDKDTSGQETSLHGRRWIIVNFVAVLLEFMVFVFLINIIMQTQYSSLEIENPDTGEVQQYYGNIMGQSASGRGRLFDSQGGLIYWGGFKDNKYEGYGEKYELIENAYESNAFNTYQCVYCGEFKNGVPDGEGKEYKYDTEYTFEKPDGESPYLHYEGKFVDGEYCGYGTIYNVDNKYSGSFYAGRFNGYGEEWQRSNNDGRIYSLQANYINGLLQGEGKRLWPNGNPQLDGTFEGGYIIKGKYFEEDGSVLYDGEWKMYKYDGEGTLYWPNGKKQYVGGWVDGKRNGSGTSYREDKTKEYEGNWEDDYYQGDGILYYEDGETPQYAGEFRNGTWIGE